MGTQGGGLVMWEWHNHPYVKQLSRQLTQPEIDCALQRQTPKQTVDHIHLVTDRHLYITYHIIHKIHIQYHTYASYIISSYHPYGTANAGDSNGGFNNPGLGFSPPPPPHAFRSEQNTRQRQRTSMTRPGGDPGMSDLCAPGTREGGSRKMR